MPLECAEGKLGRFEVSCAEGDFELPEGLEGVGASGVHGTVEVEDLGGVQVADDGDVAGEAEGDVAAIALVEVGRDLGGVLDEGWSEGLVAGEEVAALGGGVGIADDGGGDLVDLVGEGVVAGLVEGTHGEADGVGLAEGGGDVVECGLGEAEAGAGVGAIRAIAGELGEAGAEGDGADGAGRIL